MLFGYPCRDRASIRLDRLLAVRVLAATVEAPSWGGRATPNGVFARFGASPTDLGESLEVGGAFVCAGDIGLAPVDAP